MEKWKPLNDEDMFVVSSEGRVWCHSHTGANGRTIKGHFVKCYVSKTDGYVRFNFWYKGKRCCKTLHRAVAELFIPNQSQKPEVNHINGNKTDNRAENLEWCTASENQRHALNTGLRRLNCPAQSKQVGLYNQSGQLVLTFPSVAEASRSTRTSVHRIYKRCEGKTKKTINGYMWRYTKQQCDATIAN